jgi:hypothetical protein
VFVFLVVVDLAKVSPPFGITVFQLLLRSGVDFPRNYAELVRLCFLQYFVVVWSFFHMR